MGKRITSRILLLLLWVTTFALPGCIFGQNDLSDARAKGYALLDQSDQCQNNAPDSVMYYIEQALSIAKTENDSLLLASCNNYLGIFLEGQSKFADALIHYSDALRIAKNINYTLGIANFSNNIAGIYVIWGDYNVALNYYLEALTVYRQINDKDGIATIYNNLGIVYDYQKNFTMALEYYQKSLEIYREIESPQGISNTLNNIGLIHFYNKNYTLARDHFIKSLSYEFENNDKEGIATSFSNIGELYFEMGDDSTAFQYYEKALSIYQEKQNLEGIARINSQKATIYKKQGRLKDAENFYLKSLQMARNISVIELVLENLENLHKLYALQHNYKKAYETQDAFHLIQDSLFSLEKQTKFNEMQSKYDYEKHLQDIELLREKSQRANIQLEKQQLKNQQQRGILYALLLFILAVGVFLFYSAKNNRKIYQNNLELKNKNQEIEAARNELLLAKEKAEESDRLKSSFLANMSHEIRTPMNSILGFSELLAEPTLTQEEKQEYINYIKTSGKTLLTLINDIIDLAKIEAGQINMHIIPTNVNHILSELADYYNELKKRYEKPELEVVFEDGLSNQTATILTDPERFRQIMNNLLSNALKFTEKGAIRFGYTLKNNELKFFVKDSGIGIKKKHLTLIFDHFRQIDESHTRKFGGTGLGLTISRNLTEMLGGSIWAESTPGEGTTFYFTIPYHPVKEPENPNLSSMEQLQTNLNATQEPILKGKVILVAEDEESNFFLMKTQLRNTGVTLFRAKNGKEAVEMYQIYEQQIDLVLLDIQMPEMNGYEAMKKIRDKYPDTIIIAQTAHAMADEQKRIKEAGFDDYLAKPITKAKFTQLLMKYL